MFLNKKLQSREKTIKHEVIKIDDVELNLPKEVIEVRDYQYNLI